MRLYLVDGYGFIFRAYHSLPPLSSPDGTPVAAVYGFVNMMLKLCDQHKADLMAVVLDSGVKNHRHELFPEYKANRSTPPDDLKIQFPIIREALQALNITTIESDKYEADDIIASYAVSAAKSGYFVTIISSDKDLMQLLSYDNIQMHDPMKNKPITHIEVEEKFGVNPSQLRDALALIGDKSDNIPGVSGIGPKIASELIKQYGSLEAIYKNTEFLKSERIKKLLIEQQKNAFLSQELVTLKTEIPIALNFNDMYQKQADFKNLFAFAQKFGFKSLIAKYTEFADKNNNFLNKKIELKTILKSDFSDELILTIKHAGIFACHFNEKEFFLATNDINLVINYELAEQHDLFSEPSQIYLKEILLFLAPLFELDSIIKILFNAKSFIKILNKYAIKIVAFEDLAIMSYVISTRNQHKTLADLILSNGVDALCMVNKYASLKKELVNLKLISLYEKLEKPLIKVLVSVEETGILVNRQLLDTISIDLSDKARIIANAIYAIAGQEFNIGSTKQLGEILFEKLKIPNDNKKSKKSGNHYTDVDVLENIAAQGYDIASLILEWRHLTKLVNTYTEALKKNINPKSGRIHTTFEMNATTTGRLSSHNPNLQNIPIRTKEGKRIREAFIAAPGNVLISADYSQIELKLLAHFADIKQLKEAFSANKDIHAVTASEMFDVPIEKVDAELRRKAKGINFGIIYGISPFGLAKNIGISQHDAKKYIENYFIRYPGIHQYMQKTIDFAKHNGFVETICKRRCSVEGINSSNYNLRSFAERAAINAPLQGSGADIIKKAMILLPNHLLKRLVLQIHDELLFEVPRINAHTYADEIVKIMENAIQLSLPLKIDIAIKESW